MKKLKQAVDDYLLWMIPKLERFPRSQKFILADRIENLMVSEPLLTRR